MFAKSKRMKNLIPSIIEYYAKTKNISATCKEFGICRQTFYTYQNENEEFAQAIKDAEEEMLDYAESKLYKQIKDDNFQAIKYYLDRKGKSRGYGENIDVTTLGLNIVVADEKAKKALEDI